MSVRERIEPDGITQLRELAKTRRKEADRHKHRAELWEIRYKRVWADLKRVERENNLLRHKLAEVASVVTSDGV